MSELIRTNIDACVEKSTQRVFAEVASYANLDREPIRAASLAGFRAIIADLDSGEMHHYAELFDVLAYRRARLGFNVLDLNRIIDIAEQVMRDLAFHTEQLEQRLAMIEQCHKVSNSARLSMIAAFGRANRELLDEAERLVEQMSAPILPIRPGVIVLPLVGAINTRRAVRIMEALLAGIAAHRASQAIIDLTGVPVMDAVVADNLVRTARASQLLGAEVIVVGVSPVVAQTMATLNMDLSGLTTLMHLQAGLEYARDRSNQRLPKAP